LNSLYIYNDEQLVKLLSEQDGIAAFEELYNRYWKKLLVQAKLKTGSEQEAEEIVQHVFMNIWRVRKDLQIKHSFYTYISSCVKYEILASLTRQKKQLHPGNISFTAIGDGIDNHTAEWLDYESTRKQLESTVQSLPEKCQLVFRLSREKGFSEKQIAAHLNISQKTVQAHMTRALKVLRTELQQWLFFFF
jgi:RNA polymerase sigma-70 factor (family 1)